MGTSSALPVMLRRPTTLEAKSANVSAGYLQVKPLSCGGVVNRNIELEALYLWPTGLTNLTSLPESRVPEPLEHPLVLTWPALFVYSRLEPDIRHDISLLR